jgi:trk system potassium uptake protein TrkA
MALQCARPPRGWPDREEVRIVHVVIVGCGRVGSALAHALVDSGHTAAVIDRRSDAFQRLGAFDGQKLVGVGFDRDVLVDAGIERAGSVAAVTNGDNSNILVARVARETFGVERVVARIYDPRRAAVYQRLGIATVATVSWTTERVLRRVLPEAPAVEWVDPSARVSLIERTVGSGWVGEKLSAIETNEVRVVALSRLGVSMLPAPTFVVQEGDVVYLAVSADAMERVDQMIAGPAKAGGHR